MEKFSIGYKTLCKVQVLHRYFLNYGNKAFDAGGLPADEQRVVGLLKKQYDVNRFWEIKPDKTTVQTLKNQRMVFKNLPDGFIIGIETGGTSIPSVPFPAELKLVFEVYPTDNFFMLYSDISKPVMDILMKGADETVDGKIVRVGKVFRLTNIGSASQTLNVSEDIPLASLETYSNTEGIKKQPLGYIEIRDTPPAASLLIGHVVQSNLLFKVVLNNRSTQWTFGTSNLGLHPLVENGRIAVSSGGKQLPNPTPTTTFYESGNFKSIIY